jgi:hypothetical protein
MPDHSNVIKNPTIKAFYFLILKGLIILVSYCFISINNNLLEVKCYSSLVVSGFSRNEFNSHILFNFCCFLIYFYLIKGVSSLYLFIIFCLV